MGMATYPMKDVGFYVDHEVAAYIMLAAGQATEEVPNEISALLEDGTFATWAKEGTLPCDYSNPSEAYEWTDNLTTWANEFDGEVSTLFPERTNAPIEETLSDEPLVYVPAAKDAELFKAAYESPDALLGEFEALFAEQGIIFPKDFDWWAHIVSINGTYFC